MWIFGYLDPGTGYVFVQNSPGLLAWLLGILAVLLRLLYQFWKRLFLLLAFSVLLLALTLGIWFMMKNNAGKVVDRKVIVLGIDGMDPRICERLMHEGRLPHLARLAASGTFSRLATTSPAESAVAWTSFATGLNPGRHGVFDFVMRDPDRHSLYLSLNEAVQGRGGRVESRLRRRGKPFWLTLSERDIPSYIYFCPNTFPPEKVVGRLVSGMGVPDVTGVSGSFTFYTSAGLQPGDRDTHGRVVPLRLVGDTAKAALYGPALAAGGTTRPMEVPLTITVQENGVQLDLSRARFSLRPGEWSSWHEVSFSRGFLQSEPGMVRFYLKSIAPHVQLYASPVNFDPRKPMLPISHPPGHAGWLASKMGPYYTQGMPADTWALVEGRLDEKAYLEMIDTITETRQQILDVAMADFRGGAFFFYFGCLDDVQHMFWRYIDTESPLHDPSSPHRDTIYRQYEKMDAVVGDVVQRAGEAVVMVVSDHGFTAYRRSVHLNRWLIEHGYQALKPGAGTDDADPIDWAKTRAYAVGFGGIYLNRIGREYYGTVEEKDAPALLGAIREELAAFRDPESGVPVVRKVYRREEVYSGPLVERNAPDLYVGFEDGYRASWPTCLGRAPLGLVEVNRKKWSGDHMVDPSLVPGVLFVNRKVTLASPSIVDVAPTILSVLQAGDPGGLDGRALFDPQARPEPLGR